MKKNDIFELEITDMGTDGEGIGHFDGKMGVKRRNTYIPRGIKPDK